MTLNGPVKVSICIVTYNQQDYVRQCLESIIEQETPFRFEIIVGDDGSTDNTPAIIEEIAASHSDLVFPILHRKNGGPNANYWSVHSRAKGEYVAHLDGDDFALPGKLAALAAKLDADSLLNIVWHRMYILNDRGETTVGMPLIPPVKLFKNARLDLLDACCYYGATGCQSGSMYRRSSFTLERKNVKGVIIDYYRTISMLANGGYAAYIDKPYGVYRFIAKDISLTKEPEGRFVGNAKLNIFKDFAHLGYAVRRRFAAQALFDAFVRLYIGQPMKLDFIKVAFEMRALPLPCDFTKIWRLFNAHRHSKLVAAWRNETHGT